MSKFTEALQKIQDKRQEADDSPKRSRGKVPTFQLPNEITEKRPSWDAGIKVMKNTKPDQRLVTYHFPESIISEQYRMTRTSLINRIQKDATQVILVSSSIHSEGKSVTATNLAMCLSEDPNVKVALIDADLRRGKIAEYFGFGRKLRGLSNLLTESLNPKEVFVKNSRANLAVMPRGDIMKSPAALVSSDNFKMLIAELRAHFDYVIIDAPPIMSVSDPGIMAKYVDGVVFIIQVGRTPKTVISHANQLFKQSGAKVLGYILTNVEMHSGDYRYYQSYYDHYTAGMKTGMKHQTKMHFKKAGWGFEGMENKLNSWWTKKVLKEKQAAEVESEEQLNAK
ncbi:MAG: CpsD/CapB family tyrosine-protein kinase [Candidatus Omnitrophota bacterium]|nr:CpsD/CapB family tyrosine-protein kinase [Candidatus Omnitrophota bacterium]